jgi:hypothetical protein
MLGKPNMKVTIETEFEKCTVEGDGVDMHDTVQLIKQALLGVGFHPETVKEYFEEE